MEMFLQDLRHALRLLRNKPGFHDRGRRGAGARHRRQHGDLLGRQHRPAEAAALSRSRSAGDVPQHLAAGLGPGASPDQVQRLAAADGRVPGRLGLPLQRRQPHRRRNPEQVAAGYVSADFFRLFGAVAGRWAARSRRTRICPKAAARVVLERRLLAAPLRRRPERRRPHDPVQRPAARSHRRPRPVRHRGHPVADRARRMCGCRFRSIRTARCRATSSRRRAASSPASRSRRRRRSWRPAATSSARRSRSALPPQGGFGVQPLQEIDRPQRPLVAVDSARRGELRPADRVRERREPAARSRDGPPARDRDSRGDRRRARPHRAAAAHRKRGAVAARRRVRPGARHGRHPRAARAQPRQHPAHRRRRRGRRRRLARAGVHRGRVARDRARVRPVSRRCAPRASISARRSRRAAAARAAASARTRRARCWWSARWRWRSCCSSARRCSSAPSSRFAPSILASMRTRC